MGWDFITSLSKNMITCTPFMCLTSKFNWRRRFSTMIFFIKNFEFFPTTSAFLKHFLFYRQKMTPSKNFQFFFKIISELFIFVTSQNLTMKIIIYLKLSLFFDNDVIKSVCLTFFFRLI